MDVIPLMQTPWWGNETIWLNNRNPQDIDAWGRLFILQDDEETQEAGDSTENPTAEKSDSNQKPLPAETPEEEMTGVSHRGILEEFERRTGSKLGKFWKFMNEFCIAMDDPTIQQRIKELLILRAITDFELNEDLGIEKQGFGVGKLERIMLGDRNYLEPNEPAEEGKYTIYLNFSSDESDYVVVEKDNPLAGSLKAMTTKTSFLNEAMHHIYHYVVAGTLKHSPIMQKSWELHGSAEFFNPFMLGLGPSWWGRGKPGRYAINVIKRALHYDEESKQEDKERYFQQVITPIVDSYERYWRDMWSDLEKVLTATGKVPVDFSENERYRVIDEQNQYAEVGSIATQYMFANIDYIERTYKPISGQENIAIREEMLFRLHSTGRLLQKKDLDPSVRRLYIDRNAGLGFYKDAEELYSEKSKALSNYLQKNPQFKIKEEDEFLKTLYILRRKVIS